MSHRIYAILVCAVSAWAPLALSQQPGAPSFEVASIRPKQPPFRALFTAQMSGSLVRFEGYTLAGLVAEAYGVKGYQVNADAVSESARTAYYDVEARVSAGSATTLDDVRPMLRTLLTERFHLLAHREQRPMRVYELLVDKGGPNFVESKSETPCRSLIGPAQPTDRNYRYQYTNCGLNVLTDSLQGDRPIVDRTGLSGRYDISLVATPEFRLRNSSEPGDISFIDAVKPLGLRLEAKNSPIEVIVIDQVDASPTPN